MYGFATKKINKKERRQLLSRKVIKFVIIIILILYNKHITNSQFAPELVYSNIEWKRYNIYFLPIFALISFRFLANNAN